MRIRLTSLAALLTLVPFAAAQEEATTKETEAISKKSAAAEKEAAQKEAAKKEAAATKKAAEKGETPQKEKAPPEENATAMEVLLLVGEKRAAGTVTVWNDSNTLYVRYLVSATWAIHKTQLAVELDPADIPQNGKGNAKPGKFEFKDGHGKEGTSEFIVEIPLADKGWSFGDIVFVAARAKLIEELKDGTTEKEIAWGDGEPFDGPKWAMYFPYEIAEPALKKPAPPKGKEKEVPTEEKAEESTPSKEIEENQKA